MGKYRRNRINEEMAREMCEILRTVKDPRVSSCFLTVQRTDVTQDLKYAKIYYSVMGLSAGTEEQKEIAKGLKSAAPYIRTQIAERLNLRITPELQFIYDDSISYGARINEILHSATVQEDLRRFEERMEQEKAEEETASEDEFDE